MTLELFDTDTVLPLAPGAVVLRGFALRDEREVLADLESVIAEAPLRHMTVPGGHRMSVAMTNTGALGWVSDERGYRYDAVDPERGAPWPAMPASWRRLARDAAAAAGFDGFDPDASLVNRYLPGAKLSLHQDKDERDYAAPIVSVSLGMPATFLFGGTRRTDPTQRIALRHGDVVVWGGPSRLRYHGVLALKDGEPHPRLGRMRVNLTFRRAG
jgi:alkylated DNA repair protein (DNA oxidative demethylase)